MSYLYQTVELIKELKQLEPIKETFKQKLDTKFRLEFNYNSNHIEGNTLTYGETKMLLQYDQTEGHHTLREYQEMKAHDGAFLELIKQWAADKQRPVTETDIKNLNKQILVEPFWKEAITPNGQPTQRLIAIGSYKKHPNSVRLRNGELFHYASVADTPIQMGELIAWYRNEEEKNEISPVVLAAMLHYKLVRIHPFDDGNGRTARLLMNYVLLKNDLPPVIIKTAEKQKYLLALNQADAGNEDAFVEYIAQQLVWSLELSIKAAKGESIEEDDDIDKEIKMFKQQAKQASLHRTNETIYAVYTNGIKQLIELFEEKMEQFYEMFASHSLINQQKIVNDSKVKTAIIKTLSEATLQAAALTNDTCCEFSFRISLKNYEYSNTPFGLHYTLSIHFEHVQYHVVFNSLGDKDRKITKPYNQYITSEERKEFVIECCKTILTRIKVRSKPTK